MSAAAPLRSALTSLSRSRSLTTTSLARRTASSTHTSSSTTPDAATLVLLNSVASIPRYGFTRQAYLLSSSSSLPADEASRRARVISTLFPGPPSTFDSQLFFTWSRICDLAVINNFPPETVLESLKSGQTITAKPRPVQMRPPLTAAEEARALANASSRVQERLRHSWTVRQHLTHGLTSISTLSPLSSPVHSVFPHETIRSNIPTPMPLLRLSAALVDAVLTEGDTGWVDQDGPEWYAIRTRLMAGYAAATLHVAAEGERSFEETQRLFSRVVQGRERGMVAMVEEMAGRVEDWTRWGARGWLGVLRSLGL